ncbi:hypothetical protein BZA05DRAFT_417214 [Tricharina praecox]|uniref:uncharacterized protein n=1 Tax=Tricharina praecox TaxID=43433 RepID=UPI00221FC0D9|nr:uncharacterized protein BZA05DRAFT_417214 [Tricharina praecox]KAI5854700.1 hypothetical protein BZA05DRAFT_417214 [Tricharina praecox]
MGIVPTLHFQRTPAKRRPGMSTTSSSAQPQHQPPKPRNDPTIHLYIGSTVPPIYMSTSQSHLTRASRTLHRHLRAQVPNRREYESRDKTMMMRNEAAATVARFLEFLERGSYTVSSDAEGDEVRVHLRMYVFAVKYEVPRLAGYARRRAGAVLERMVAAGDGDVLEIGTADTREREGKGGEVVWAGVCAVVLKGVEEQERSVLKEVLGKLVAPFIWRASGAW